MDAQLRAAAPPAVRELLPVIDQLEPVLMEVANGADEFVPAPDDAKDLLRKYYGVRRNLLVRFRDDGIDETSTLAAVLTDSSAIAETLDLSVRSLAGDHVRPCRQRAPEIPAELAAPIAQTGDALSGLADMFGIAADESPANPLGNLRAGFEAVKKGVVDELAGEGGAAEAEMRDLAAEIADWMAIPPPPPAKDAEGEKIGGESGGAGDGEGEREQITPTIVTP
jgi:hypothetical protein